MGTTKAALKADGYLIDVLARSGIAFEDPSNEKNNNELIQLSEAIPRNVTGYWHQLKYGLNALVTIGLMAVSFSILAATLPVVGLSVGFTVMFVGGAMMYGDLRSAEISFKSEELNNPINSMIKTSNARARN